MRIDANTTTARALGITLVSIWKTWDENNETAYDDALRFTCESIRELIAMEQVDGALAAPLNYFVRAYLDDDNPEDLTYDEMLSSISIGVTQSGGAAS